MLHELANSARSSNFAPISLVVSDDVRELEVEWEIYAKDHKLDPKLFFKRGHAPVGKGYSPRLDNNHPDKLCAFVIGFDYESIGRQIIGPSLNAMEAWPRLGQTVLDILEGGLSKTTRCLSPGNAIDWASELYWGCEQDEEMMIEEELSCIADDVQAEHKKANPTAPPLTAEQIIADHISTLRRKQLDADIPVKWHRGRKTLKKLPKLLGQPMPNESTGLLTNVFWVEEYWPKIYDACQKIIELGRKDVTADNRYSHQIIWEAIPIWLPMHKNDCTGRMLDDMFNRHFEAGDVALDCNAMFLWWDAPSVARAARRVQNFLRLTQACEELIALLHLPEGKEQIEIPVEQPIPVQVRV